MDLDNHPAFENQDATKRPQILVDLLRTFHRQRNNLRMLEIGSIRVDDKQYHDGDGHSTVYFSRFADEFALWFITVDINIDVCQSVLDREKLSGVEVVQQDGLEYLKDQENNSFDFIYLDGPDNAQYTMEMLKEAMRVCADDGLVALDDCEDIEDIKHKPDAEKGKIVLPVLKQLGVPIRRLGKKILVLNVVEFYSALEKANE